MNKINPAAGCWYFFLAVAGSSPESLAIFDLNGHYSDFSEGTKLVTVAREDGEKTEKLLVDAGANIESVNFGMIDAPKLKVTIVHDGEIVINVNNAAAGKGLFSLSADGPNYAAINQSLTKNWPAIVAA